ncbi:GntR family transcriptional regulator [Georgenia soli]|uniref:GntR family transcriptional regulator n=1 Tax=Georgenia soli TaxID=638953 RepID=UPI001474B276|nr:GntR family transcriptional regulator [Georgenia soli]
MQHVNLRDRAYEAIRTAIVSKEIPPGARLSEAKLAAMLQVSKTPVREALVRLAGIGLIEHDGRSGLRVPEPSVEAIRNAYELREGLEAQSGRLAARSVSAEAVQPAFKAAAECLHAAENGDSQGFRLGDRRFHMSLSRATGNPYLAEAVANAYDLALSLRMRDTPVVGFNIECAQDHMGVLEAVDARDESLAAERMLAHVAKIKETVLASYPTGIAAAG